MYIFSSRSLLAAMSHPITTQPAATQHMKPGYTLLPGQPPYEQPPYEQAQYGQPIPSQLGYVPEGPSVLYGPSPQAWMPIVQSIPNCPKGLEYLTQLDQVLIKQEANMIEVTLHWNYNNKNKIINNQNQLCYHAFEKSSSYARLFYGANRGFKIHVTDINKEKIFTIKRPYKCCGGSNWCADIKCCQDEVSVYGQDGTQFGYVRQVRSFWKPHYIILDHNKDPKFEIWETCYPCPGCFVTEFLVRTFRTDTVIASITKLKTGESEEFYTEADDFEISFPMDLNVKLKATLIGFTFFIILIQFTHLTRSF